MKHMLCRAALTMVVLSALGTASVGAVEAQDDKTEDNAE